MSLAEKLDEQGIKLDGYGDGSRKTLCPQCSHTRKNAKEPCLSVKIDEKGATWNCHHCQWSGGVTDRTEFTVHRPSPKAPPRMPPIRLITPEAVAYLTGRGLRRETLDLAGVGSSVAYIPELGAEVPCIAFPYRVAGGKIANIKFRTRDKKFAKVKGGEKLFFGWDRADPNDTQLVVCEGEIDALSLTQAGVSNAVSVPDGASDRKLDFLGDKDLLAFTRIVLAVDNDGPGRELAEELSRRFGKERCWSVTWPEGCKDANDVLVKFSEAALRDCIDSAQPHPIKSLFDAGAYREDALNLYRGLRKQAWSTGWKSVDGLMKVRAGELTVVTGIPGSGKSEFIDALTMNLAANHGWRFAVCSFENPPEEHLAKLAEKRVGQPFWNGHGPRMTEATFNEAADWISQRYWFIRADDEAPTIDWILETARAAAIRHGINGLVIDPYNEIEHQRAPGMTETEHVSQMLGKVKRFAQNHDIHIWFVAHPAKLQRNKDGSYPPPSLYDISGSANWSNKADIGIIVDRFGQPEGDVMIHVKKVRFKAVGQAGEVTLSYERSTGRYFDKPAHQSAEEAA